MTAEEDSGAVKKPVDEDAVARVDKRGGSRVGVGRRIWRLIHPLVDGVTAVVALLLLSWLLVFLAEVMDLGVLIPVSAALRLNLQWFFAWVASYNYLRRLGGALGGGGWVVRPMASGVLITGALWASGLVIEAVNETMESMALAQAGGMLSDNTAIVFVLAAGVLYAVYLLERVFAR